VEKSIMRGSFKLAFLAGTAVGFASAAALAQEVVYDNTVTGTGFYYGSSVTLGNTTGPEIGDQIVLAGAGRSVTQFVIKPYYAGTAAASGTAQIKFYNFPAVGTNPGTSGAPIWDSGPVAQTFATGAETLTFTVPNVTVPNEFVWTATFVFSAPATGGYGHLINNPPATGTSADFFWQNDAGTWTQYFFNGAPVANFAAQVTAQSVVVTGACCKTDGTCSVITNTACAGFPGAVFQGTGTTCGTCPQPGACCQSAGVCTSTTQSACLALSGVFGGEGITCGSANCSHQYFYDNGTGEANIGFGGTAASIAWLNRYTVANNLSTINAIEIAFGVNGANSNPVSLDGTPVTVYLWSDPNGDGSPVDAVVLRSASGVVANSGTDTFNTFPITPFNVGPNGTNFFVGAILTETVTSTGAGTGVYPCREDTEHTQGKSWISGNANTTPVDPNNLNNSGTAVAVIDSFGLNGNWMIRADASAGGSTCYANCDNSTAVPFLNVQDFSCFLTKYAAGNSYANCDNSTQPPVLNVSDFSCFLTKYATGCSAP
jgi:hypothetical protein